MEKINEGGRAIVKRPVKVLQFGEGNFLRAFVDYMIDIANEKTDLDAGIVLVKPITFGSLEGFRKQDNLYTVMLRGLVDGVATEQSRMITSVQDTVDAYAEYEKYSDYAKLDTLRYIVSNTTEAGIVLDESDKLELCPPNTYPGKLCKFLYERAEAFDYAEDKGLIMLPVELIDDNGIKLKECVLALAKLWNLGDKFINWLNTACVFTSTLVDRIVTGAIRDENERQAAWEKIGYEDQMLVTGEPFALWVIESPRDLSDELPLPQCGLPVIYTDNQKPYKQRKVRILNGAHTSFVPAAFQCGYDIVLDAMHDDLIKNFMQKTLYDEVIPTLALPKEDLMSFAEAVTGRFENPFIKHRLLDICLNSVSKWRARCMPSLLGYVEKTGELPARLTFSLASLMALYHGGELKDGVLVCSRNGEAYTLKDDADVLAFFAEGNSKPADELVHAFLSSEHFFGQDLTAIPGLEASVLASYKDILARGMKAVMTEKFGG
ncbi:MAG: tagaturonate reductase [Clostridia bacterium]|nr:tagaturonate reductase [Clostridia bacterium]